MRFEHIAIKPGVRVGASFRESHKHRGTVLDACDIEAWKETIFATGREITSEMVQAHVARCRREFPSWDDRVPVKWDFGRVYWERIESLFPVK